jgi:DNA adenine methylase
MLAHAIRMTPYSRVEYVAAQDDAEDPVEQARRFLVRSWQGNGSKLVGASGWRRTRDYTGRNVLSDWMALPDRIERSAERLRGVYVENRDALTLIREYDSPDCALYVDPPYHPGTLREHRRFYRHELTDQDHAQLLDAMLRHRGAVALSGYAHPVYESALKGWTLLRFEAIADGGRHRIENLWLNPAAANAVECDGPRSLDDKSSRLDDKSSRRGRKERL